MAIRVGRPRTSGGAADLSTVVKKSTTLTTVATEGQVQELNIDVNNVSAGAEPIIYRAFLSGVRKRVAWINEALSWRFAAVQAEPSVKIFKTYAPSYTGLILQILTTWDGAGSQRHLFGIASDGRPVIGDGGVGNTQTTASHVKVLGSAEAVPAAPPETVFFRKPA